MAKNGKKKTGRPTKLNDEIRKQAVTMAQLGFVDRSIAHFVGVHPSTVLRWKERDESFATSLDMARAKGAATVMAELHKQIRAGSTRATIFWLRSRCKMEFGDQNPYANPDQQKVIVEVRDRTTEQEVAVNGSTNGSVNGRH